VFVTFDLDGLDPGILPPPARRSPADSTGSKRSICLKAVAGRSRIVGFDVVELAPIPARWRLTSSRARSSIASSVCALAPPWDSRRARELGARAQPGPARARGHPWIFSNEIDRLEGDPGRADSSTCSIRAARSGRAYYNAHSLIAARLLTRGRDDIDVEFFVKRLERARRLRDSLMPGETVLRVVYAKPISCRGSSSIVTTTCSRSRC
jgi:hypothetical protein